MRKARSDSTYQPLDNKVSVSLADVMAINTRNTVLNKGYDNLKKMHEQKTQKPTDYQDGQMRDVVSRMMLNDALARFGRYNLDTNLFASSAHAVGVMFKNNVQNTNEGYEYGPFIPYFYESAVLSCIQEHIAKSEYNLLRDLPIDAINLNTENESKDAPIIGLRAVQSLMGKIHREVSEEFQQIEGKNRENLFSASRVDPEIARDYSKALKDARNYAKGFIAMIDAELKVPEARNNPILVCQRLKALSQAISNLQGMLAHHHINLNRVAILERDERSQHNDAQLPESLRQYQAYLKLFQHDNSEEDHIKNRMGIYNANSVETLGTLASDDEMQTVARLIGRAAGNLQVQKDEPLTQETLLYVKTQFKAEIDNEALPILVANQRLQIQNEWRDEWLGKADNIDRLAKAVAKAEGGFPFHGVTDEQLQAVIENEMTKVPEKLRDFMKVEGVNFIREVVAVTNTVLESNKDNKVKPEVEFTKRFADKLAFVWQRKCEAAAEFQVEILTDTVKAHGINDAQRNTVAIKVAERKIAESGLTSEIKIGHNAILAADQYRKAAANTSSTMQRVNQDMSAKTMSVDNQAKPEHPSPPPVPPVGDKNQYVTSRLADKSGRKLPNVSWVRKSEAPAQTAAPAAAEEKSKENDSGSTPSFGK